MFEKKQGFYYTVRGTYNFSALATRLSTIYRESALFILLWSVVPKNTRANVAIKIYRESRSLGANR